MCIVDVIWTILTRNQSWFSGKPNNKSLLRTRTPKALILMKIAKSFLPERGET
jgi:hypothetical protein